ncbi:PLD nuclease N-terminal domain-containing protein [Streptomyces sp. B8F3]|uniref:PLD nuclease N-terminal domain-containing protein n=1 Tax=Streptomyces sp. B8F3 TaxID=3153573 RepID=UPI00325D8EC1
MLRYLPLMILLGVVIYALIDCATTKKEDAKHLPKIAWLILIVLFPLLGSIGWLLAGRNRRRPAGGGSGGGTGGAGGGRRTTWVAPDDNPEFLKKLGDENNTKGDENGDDEGDDDGKRDGDPRTK